MSAKAKQRGKRRDWSGEIKYKDWEPEPTSTCMCALEEFPLKLGDVCDSNCEWKTEDALAGFGLIAARSVKCSR